MEPDTGGPNVIHAAGEDRSREPSKVPVSSMQSNEKRKLRAGQKFTEGDRPQERAAVAERARWGTVPQRDEHTPQQGPMEKDG